MTKNLIKNMTKTFHFIFFALILLISFFSKAATEVEAQKFNFSPDEKNESCSKFATQKLKSRDECARKAGEVLLCEFNRSVTELNGKRTNLEFDAKLVSPSAKTVDSFFPTGLKKEKEAAEILSYTYSDSTRGIAVYARATWWKTQSVCAF